jgi:hypothetical protein
VCRKGRNAAKSSLIPRNEHRRNIYLESSNLLLLIPVVIGLVMVVRWFQRKAVFTERDWHFSLATRVRKFCRGAYGSVSPLCFGRGGDWVCPRSLRFVLRFRLVCGRIHYRRCGCFARCAEVITLTNGLIRPLPFPTFRSETSRPLPH